MTQKIQNGHGMVPLPVNQLIATGRGYSVVRGCGVVLTDNETEIEVTVNSGRVVHDGDELTIEDQTVTLQDGSIQGDRWDLIWIDRFGAVRTKTGQAGDTIPADEDAALTWNPPPPDGTVIDGIPIASIWVPGNATNSADLTNSENVVDRRVEAPPAGTMPRFDADPDQRDLRTSRLWFNESANAGDGAFRGYNPITNEIVEFDTTTVSSLGPAEELIIEDFEDNVDPNWRGGDSEYVYKAPAFEGDAAAHYEDSGVSTKYSLPGDGLELYPEEGDTISAAVRVDGVGYVEFGWGKEDDDISKDYRLRLDDYRDNRVLYYRRDGDGSENELATLSVSIQQDTWYILEAEYDGGGEGVHPVRIWSTDNGERDTILAEETAPPADTTYRGRGVSIRFRRRYSIMDRLAVE